MASDPPLDPTLYGALKTSGVRLIAWSSYRKPERVVRERRPSRDHWMLYLLLQGRALLQLPHGRQELVAPALFVLRPGEAFLEDLLPEDGGIWMVNADFAFLTLPGWPDPLRLVVQPIIVADALALFGDAWNAWAERAGGFVRGDHPALLRGRVLLQDILTELFIRGWRAGLLRLALGAPPRWLQDFADQAARRFKDPDLDLTAMSDRAGVSPQRLCQVFRRWFDLTPMEWLRRERITNACVLLRHHDDLAVATVAERCGYRSPALFSRHFRQVTGLAPRAWRRAAGGGGTGDRGAASEVSARAARAPAPCPGDARRAIDR